MSSPHRRSLLGGPRGSRAERNLARTDVRLRDQFPPDSDGRSVDGVRSQTGPLDDVRVVDFTTNVPGPQTTKVLRQMGATILKIEPPRGDSARLLPALFERLNHGKTSVRLDLRTPEGLEEAWNAIERADVVIESFRPGVMERFGLAAQQVLARRPDLVYCSITGFGQQGPYAELPAHDLNLQAMSGLAHLLRDSGGAPSSTALPIADFSASATAVYEILAALRVRDQTGRGAYIDVALIDAIADWVETWSMGVRPDADRLLDVVEGLEARWLDRAGLTGALAKRKPLRRLTRRMIQSRWFSELGRKRLHALPHYGLFETRDGRHLSVGIVDEQKFWRGLCERCGLSPLASLPLAARVVLAAPLRRVLAHALARRTLAEWMEVFGSDLPVAPVLTTYEATKTHAAQSSRPRRTMPSAARTAVVGLGRARPGVQPNRCTTAADPA